MSRPPTAIHLCAGADAAKTLLALREAGVATIAVNTSRRIRMAELDVWPEHFPIAANLYERFRSPVTALARYAFCWLPALGGAALRASGAGPGLAQACEQAGGADFIFAHWGTGILPEVALLKSRSAYADLPVVLNMETFPTDWRGGARERFEEMLLRRMAPLVDALIVPTAAMAEQIERTAPARARKPRLVAPFYFPRSFSVAADPPAIPARSGDDVVFTGWVDLRSSLNDVRPQLLELARAGLCVHTSPTPRLEHPNVRVFQRFPTKAYSSGALASFMRRFRASLVTFNAPPGDAALARFQTSLPTRLLFSLAVGVPVLLPRGLLGAGERLVEANDAGLVFDSPTQARDRLLAPEWADVQRRVFAGRDRFAFDAEAFRGLVERVVGAPLQARG